MTLQEQIKKDLTAAIKEKDEEKKATIRVIMGEFGRSDKKEIPDDDVVKILKKLVKSEKEVLERKGDAAGDSQFIRIIENYLPKMAGEEEIADWIKENVDFSKFKNKMQAMGLIMKHFGSAADGNTVKSVLQKF
ncbi:GatB/YqeY domain-containing protein [Desulfonema magnum]|uniref:Yqey-like protein n=1 Tax=Desulfonema magnum TaxID=45655 RepID=A0A975BKG3_9BACT|nr:GatB/YqeY domain-containing protein [Desulfonema magnum]QTA87151.1 Yqey-like protein [Desulfonema magnum]